MQGLTIERFSVVEPAYGGRRIGVRQTPDDDRVTDTGSHVVRTALYRLEPRRRYSANKCPQ